MVGSGPSPKRRRTDNAPLSADAIAQANQTLQIFTGQRQNRWMQGVDLNEEVAVGRQTASSVQTGGTAPATDASGSPQQRAKRQRGDSLDDAINTGAQASAERVTTSAGATGMEKGPPTNIVQYESPCTASAPSANAMAYAINSRPSIDGIARLVEQPGVPSPAPSDDNTASPALNMHGHFVPKSSHQTPVGTNGVQPPSSGTAPSFSNWTPTILSNGPPVAHPIAHVRTVSTPTQVLPSQPAISAQHPPPQQQPTILSPLAMNARLQAFEASGAVRQNLGSISNGRLSLLKDALSKSDWFYIVLSQIHCLTGPTENHIHLDRLPNSMSGLQARHFAYLDALLCPNEFVNAGLLEWLSHFPAPLNAIYASQDTAQAYEQILTEIRTFLEFMVENFTKVLDKCNARHAPPLMDDLYHYLGLSSPVLQTTTFRAIARLIWVGADQAVLDQLEVLHKLDQQCFARGKRRSPKDKKEAIKMFRQGFEAWNAHVTRRRGRQERRTLLSDFVLPVEVNRFFRAPFVTATVPHAQDDVLRPLSGAPVNVPGFQTPTQQRQAIANNEMRMHGRSVSGAHAQTPTRPPGPQTPTPNRNANGIWMPPQQKPPGVHLVYPHQSELPRAQPTHPDSNRSALHQAHLRSPLLQSNQGDGMKKDSLLYRYVGGYGLNPARVTNDSPIQYFPFIVEQRHLDKLVPTLAPAYQGEPPLRKLEEEMLVYRLRVAAGIPDDFKTESLWTVAETVWPEDLYVELNGVILEPRRKLHHGRYLPIDVTQLIKLGTNKVRTIVNRTSNDDRAFDYLVTVEIVGVKSHSKIIKELTTISSANSLSAIKKQLGDTTADDELAITSSTLTIKLFDPYSGSKIYDRPVRGASCKHRDCFDLETFLSMCKRQQPGCPTVVDCWRCPLCRGDVRPQTLVVDGFLVEVREELVKRGLLDTRAIIVEANGSWEPKAEERTGVRSASLDREEAALPAANAGGRVSAPPKVKKAVEIIEID